MKPLGEEARSLIEDAAGAYEPTAEDKKRLRSEVGARIAAVSVGIGVAATTTSVTTTTAAKTAATAAVVAKTGGVALGTKIGAVLVVASAAVVGAWLASGEPTTARDERELASTKVVEREPSSRPPVGPGQGGPKPTAELTPASEAPPATTTTSPPPPAANAVRVAPTASSAPKLVEDVASAKPSPAAPPTESETSYIRRAESAIDAGDGITALRALDDHGKTYPDGILAGRRDVLRVIATCTVGRVPAAREQAEKFLAEHPRSAEAARIRRVCGTP